MTLIYLALAWLVGLLLGSIVGGADWWLVGGLLVGGLAALVAGRRWTWGRLVAACLIVAALALLRYAAALPTIDPSVLSFYNGSDVHIVRGVVSGPPEVREKDVRLRFTARAVWLVEARRWQAVSGDAQVLLAMKERGIAYGDIIELHGSIVAPPDYDSSSSYREYLARQGILSYIPYPSLTPLGHDDSPLARFYATIYAWRGAAAEVIYRDIPGATGGLLVGILLGDRSHIDSGLNNAFAVTGVAQVVAISGQNISYVAGFIWLLGRRLPLRPRTITIVTIEVIAVYAIFVGASPSVLRAAVMGALYALARYWGRDYDVGISLAVAAWAMTLFNPLWLWDIGFQLSFVALLGIVYLAPTIARPLHRLPLLGEALAVSLAAQLVTEPLILLYFGQISLISPLANLIVEPALPLVMLTGAVAVPLLFAAPPLGLLIAGACWVFLAFMVNTVQWFASLPFAALRFPPINGWWVVAYYLALVAVLVGVEGRLAERDTKQSVST